MMIKHATRPWLKSSIAFLYVTGCRVSEMLLMLRSYFRYDSENLYVTVPILKEKRKKGPYGTPRRILTISLYSPFVKDVIIPYIGRFDKQPYAAVWSYSRQIVWRDMKKLNPKVTPHILRHDRAMKLAMQGATMTQLMDWMGWVSPASAAPYLRLTGRLASQLKDLVE